jgi:hypothetical protein
MVGLCKYVEEGQIYIYSFYQLDIEDAGVFFGFVSTVAAESDSIITYVNVSFDNN